MTLVTKNNLLLAKVEVTPGTAETVDETDGAFNVFDSSLLPNIPVTERPGQNALSMLASVPAGREATCSFAVELRDDPAWKDIFLPSCGWVDDVTNNDYHPTSDTSLHKTLTITRNVGGKRYSMKGAMGTFVIQLRPGLPTRLVFNYRGVWNGAADTAMPATEPAYPLTVPPRFASVGTLTIAAYTPRFSSMDVDAGARVELLPDATKVEAFLRAFIVDRRVVGTLDPEEELVATYDPHSDWITPTEKALTIAYDTNLQISIPKFQLTNVQQGDRGGVDVTPLTFQANRNAAAGDDEISLVVGAAI